MYSIYNNNSNLEITNFNDQSIYDDFESIDKVNRELAIFFGFNIEADSKTYSSDKDDKSEEIQLENKADEIVRQIDSDIAEENTNKVLLLGSNETAANLNYSSGFISERTFIFKDLLEKWSTIQ